jgi:lipid-A-disaccharide synthase
LYCGCSKSGVFFYESFITNKNIKFISNKTYDLLKIATAALVTSGTATLETALSKFQRLCVIKEVGLLPNCKTDYYLKYISLVNLIMDEEVVTELIQEDFNTKKIKILKNIRAQPSYPTIAKVRNIRKNWVVLDSEQTAKLIITSLKQHYSQSKNN